MLIPNNGLVSSFFSSVVDPAVDVAAGLPPNENPDDLLVSLGFAVVDAPAPNEKLGLEASEDVALGVEVEAVEPNENPGFVSLFSVADVFGAVVVVAVVDFGAEPKLKGASFFASVVFVAVEPNEKAGFVAGVAGVVEPFSVVALVDVEPNEKAGFAVDVPMEGAAVLFEVVPNENDGLEAEVVDAVGAVVDVVEPNEKAGFESVGAVVDAVVGVLFVDEDPNEKAGFEAVVVELVEALGVAVDPNENAGFEAAGVVDDPNNGVVVVDVPG